MRVTWERETDMAYLYRKDPIEPGEVGETVLCTDEALTGMVGPDLDSTGRILGIEVGPASKLLPPALLDRAEPGS